MVDLKTTEEIVRLWNEGEAGQAFGALCDRIEALEAKPRFVCGDPRCPACGEPLTCGRGHTAETLAPPPAAEPEALLDAPPAPARLWPRGGGPSIVMVGADDGDCVYWTDYEALATHTAELRSRLEEAESKWIQLLGWVFLDGGEVVEMEGVEKAHARALDQMMRLDTERREALHLNVVNESMADSSADSYRERCDQLREANAALTESRAEVERLDTALKKINEIRISIVGMQGFNFSEHAYPLVAALNAAGYEAPTYKEAAENFGTMAERTNAAEARLAEVELERDGARRSLRKWEEGEDLKALGVGQLIAARDALTERVREAESQRDILIRERADLVRARYEVRAFAVTMEQKLQDNDHKGTWEDCSNRYLLRRLKEEVAELVIEVENTGERSVEAIGKEAADVGNIAMMIADNAGALPDTPAPTPPQGGPERCSDCAKMVNGVEIDCEGCPIHPAAQGETTGEEGELACCDGGTQDNPCGCNGARLPPVPTPEPPTTDKESGDE